ncbi:MAG: EamA family transporter [Ignavibacteriales bacterium]|nr:EamA family transporter [Ignavibacteriales bacterium]
MNKENIKAYIAWINICIVWGTTYLAIRIGVEGLPPMLFAGLRWILAGSILFIYLKLSGYKLPDRKEFLHISVIGILLLGFGNGLVVVGEQWIESGLAALLITTVPFWIVGLEAFMPGAKKINALVLIGLFLGLAGVTLIFGSNLKYLFEPSHIAGIISLMIAVAIWSIGTLYSKYKKLNVHPLMSASVQMLVAGVLQTILGIILGELPKLNFQVNSFLAFLYLVTFGSLIGYTSYIYAVTHLPVSLVSTYAYINPVIAVFLGWLVLGETLNLITVIASFVIILGVAIVKRGVEKSKMELIPTSEKR